MKKAIFLIITIFLATGFKGTVQQVDEKRMYKDLEIAKNILGTLIKTESGSFFGSEGIKADYIKDYGVVFTIPEHLVYFHMGGPYPVAAPNIEIPIDIEIAPMPEMNFDFNFEGLSEKDKAGMEREMEKAQRDMKAAQEEMQKVQEQMNKAREEAMEAQQEAHEEAVQAQVEAQLAQEEALAVVSEDNRIGVMHAPKPPSDIDWEELMITFLADYADLIAQLQPEERIVVKQQAPGGGFSFTWEGDEESAESESISAEVKRQDITAYKTGKISREEFVKRVVIKKSEPQKKIADLEMFSSVLSRFFSQELTESLVVLGKAKYEKLEGFGVIYYVSTEDPDRISSRRYYSPDRRSAGEEATDDAGLDKLYADFKQDIKEFVLDYGRTIRSVGDAEKVQVNVKLPRCSQCQVPKSMEVTVPMSMLKQYDQQKITKEKVLAQMELIEN